jgi:predicted DsbA family dithiol-disulfide isomerase
MSMGKIRHLYTYISETKPPKCYVGKKRMEQAITSWRAKHPDSSDTFTTSWFPFYLNPDSPKQGIDKQAYYHKRFGPERTAMMQSRLGAIGESVGIHFKFGGKTGNTRDAHRLIQLGKTHGPDKQTRVIEELFAAYFENEKDVTSHEVLQQAGIDAGLDGEEVRAWLESDKGGPEVDREVQQAKSKFISGVPFFTINGRYHLEGAEDPSAFLEIFESISGSEDKASTGGRPTAETC